MAKSQFRSNSLRRRSQATAAKGLVARPGGKLGLILARISRQNGATADELVKATGWQRPSVLAALSRLNARGFALRLDTQSERKAYRLNPAKG